MIWLRFRIFDQLVKIAVPDEGTAALVRACYSAFEVSDSATLESPLVVTVRQTSDSSWSVQCEDESMDCPNRADLVYFVEKLMTIELQYRRPDLYFIHGAALLAGERAFLLVGESGAGKSTLCWTLSNLGCGYLSDELAPVDVGQMSVAPYPHALCLKAVTPGMPELPDSVIETEATMHVPTTSIDTVVNSGPIPVSAVFFLDKEAPMDGAQLTSVGDAEATARIYANTLNQLSHPGDGLAAAKSIATAVPTWRVPRVPVVQRAEWVMDAAKSP